MKKSEQFYRKKIKTIFEKYSSVVDIGGGLRISKNQGNRYDKKSAWMLPYLEKVNYKIMDPVSDYGPDIIGDIHSMPFEDESIDAIVCVSVLEHVEDPITASKEIYRVLKQGGACLVYAPFLYYYHAEKGYYGDYWRFTEDTIEMLFKKFRHKEIQNARGATETLVRLSPLGRMSVFLIIAGFLDRVFKKTNSKQTSGYYIYLEK